MKRISKKQKASFISFQKLIVTSYFLNFLGVSLFQFFSIAGKILG